MQDFPTGIAPFSNNLFPHIPSGKRTLEKILRRGHKPFRRSIIALPESLFKPLKRRAKETLSISFPYPFFGKTCIFRRR
jgi:hypothetical protein